MTEAGNGLRPKRTITIRRERLSLKQSDESSNSKPSLLAMLSSSDARQTVFIYVVGLVLMLFGGVYAIWRIDLLSSYLQYNRHYVLERDQRWERHIQGQAEAVQEILRRLPQK